MSRPAHLLRAPSTFGMGLRAYGRQGRIALVSRTEAAQARVLTLWTEARARHGNGEVIIATRENRDAMALDAAARVVLRQEGKLARAEVVV